MIVIGARDNRAVGANRFAVSEAQTNQRSAQKRVSQRGRADVRRRHMGDMVRPRLDGMRVGNPFCATLQHYCLGRRGTLA